MSSYDRVGFSFRMILILIIVVVFVSNGRWRSEWKINFNVHGGPAELKGMLKLQVFIRSIGYTQVYSPFGLNQTGTVYKLIKYVVV